MFISDRLEQVLSRLSEAIVPALCTFNPRLHLLQYILHDLTKLETRPWRLTEMAYGWCSVICENTQGAGYHRNLLLLSLEIGFRHLHPHRSTLPVKLTHTIHHRHLVDIVFESRNGDLIADVLHAWTLRTYTDEPLWLLDMCVRHLIDLHHLVPFSSKLRQLVIRSVALIGYRGFEQMGVERFIELLDHLHVGIEDIGEWTRWGRLLLDIVQSTEGIQHLSHQSWGLLVEPRILGQLRGGDDITYDPQITTYLEGAKEWEKLECWMGVIWMLWPPETERSKENLERAMVSLFRQRPGAPRKLKQWMDRWSQHDGQRREDVFKTFQWVCKRAHETSQQEIL